MKPLKVPTKEVVKIEVPDFEITGMDNNASMWLNFPNMPFSKKDVVLAVADRVIGASYPMYFKPSKKNLFPLMIQMDGSHVDFDITYYCFKLNKVYKFSEYLTTDDVIGSPVFPFVINKEDMDEISGI